MFIAIIALAAAPQALQDARRLANAVQDRAESEFWSIFLSYQTPNSRGVEARGKTELLAARRSDGQSSCPLQRMAVQVVEAVSDSQTSRTLIRTRTLAESRPARAKAKQVITPEAVEPQADDETMASLAEARAIEFSERGKSALDGARPHARDSEKMSGALPKPAMAFSWQDNETRIKVRPVMEINKFLRRKARDLKERNDVMSRELPETPGEEGM